MKNNTTKKMLALLFACIFILLPMLTLASGRVVYGKNCMTNGGTANCNGWKISIVTHVCYPGRSTAPVDYICRTYPSLDLQLVNDGFVFPSNFPPEALITQRGGRYTGYRPLFPYTTYITIIDPKGEKKVFIYEPWDDGWTPYIHYPQLSYTGGASLNRPENGSVTIEGSAW